jgi:hypothetical protein
MATTTKPCRTRKTTKPSTIEEWGQLLTRAENGSDARAEAMIVMRELGASFANLATAMGVVPLTARARVLKAQAAK